MTFAYLTISRIKQGLGNKDFSCVDLVNHYFRNIKEQADLNAYITLTKEEALAEAKKVDEKIGRGEKLANLAGVPMAIKDIILTKGIKTTAGSRILANYIAPYDATVVRKLKSEGAILLGKTNCDEFAMGSSNETSAFGPVLNPWDKARVPGGSSGGSAVAVAADQCAFALGTDTGGSIRQPASLCGLVGLKPTWGRVSRFGLAAMTSSLDQPGPMARCVEDAALILKSIAGKDDCDQTSSSGEVDDYLVFLSEKVKGMKVGLPREYFKVDASKEVKAAIKEAIAVLENLGVKFEEISLPHSPYALAAYYIIMPAEASSNLARYDGIRYGQRTASAQNLWQTYAKTRSEGFGDEVKRRVMMGTYVLSAGYRDSYYRQAKKVQELIKQEYDLAFKKVDALITPTSPTVAFSLGEKTADPLTMYLSDIYTVSANIAGLCGISVPAGLSEENLPIGLQILGAPFKESAILKLAYHYQEATKWHNQHPEK